jgi:hypothetical protein
VFASYVDDMNSAPVDNVNSGDGVDNNVDINGGDDFSTFQARTHLEVLSPGFSMVSNLTW